MMFVFVLQSGQSQNFVGSEDALKRIEIQQAAYQKEYADNTMSKLKNDISKRFFEVVVLYIKEGIDVANALEVALVKSLETFIDNQEEVVDFKEEAVTLLEDN